MDGNRLTTFYLALSDNKMVSVSSGSPLLKIIGVMLYDYVQVQESYCIFQHL